MVIGKSAIGVIPLAGGQPEEFVGEVNPELRADRIVGNSRAKPLLYFVPEVRIFSRYCSTENSPQWNFQIAVKFHKVRSRLRDPVPINDVGFVHPDKF